MTAQKDDSNKEKAVRVKTEQFDLDSIYQELGDFGKFQIKNYLLICVAVVFYSMYTINYIFTSGTVDYRCAIDDCEVRDGSSYIFSPTWMRNAIPLHGECMQFEQQQNITIQKEQCMDINVFNHSKLKRCEKFVFRPTESTIQTEFNLTCKENQWKLTVIGTINNIGLFLFMPFTGYISDRYGRRNILIVGVLCCGVFGLLKSFAINYAMFAIMEFLDAAAGSGIAVSTFILGMELIGPGQRVLVGSLSSTCFAVGGVFLGIVAMLSQDYKLMLRIIYAPAFLIVLYVWLIPESIRWLMVAGQQRKAVNILLGAAKTNNVTLSARAMQALHDQCNVTTIADCADEESLPVKPRMPKATPFRQILQSKILLGRIVNCSFCWLTNTFVFYGLSLSSVTLEGNKYANFMVACVAEVPGYLLVFVILNRLGRRWSLCGSLLVCGFACVATEMLPDTVDHFVRLAVFLVAKCAITVSFTVLYVYTAEIYPTQMRNGLMSACSTVGRIGSMLAPQIPFLARLHPSLPFLLFAMVAIVSGLLVLSLPETLNTKLPDTVEEAENLGCSYRRTEKEDH